MEKLEALGENRIFDYGAESWDRETLQTIWRLKQEALGDGPGVRPLREKIDRVCEFWDRWSPQHPNMPTHQSEPLAMTANFIHDAVPPDLPPPMAVLTGWGAGLGVPP